MHHVVIHPHRVWVEAREVTQHKAERVTNMEANALLFHTRHQYTITIHTTLDYTG